MGLSLARRHAALLKSFLAEIDLPAPKRLALMRKVDETFREEDDIAAPVAVAAGITEERVTEIVRTMLEEHSIGSGAAPEIELRAYAGFIQWRRIGGVWKDLVAFEMIVSRAMAPA